MPLRVPTLHTIGVDIVKISRFAKHASSASGTADDSVGTHKFLRKFMTPREITAFLKAEVGRERRVEFLASRWAAKEAVIKAVQTRKLVLRDVEIYNRPGGSPFAVVLDDLPWGSRHGSSTVKHYHDDGGDRSTMGGSGRGLALVADPEELEGDVHGTVVGVSISHEGEYAIAMAIAAE